MKLNFIGSGGAFDNLINASAYYETKEVLLLLDVGENTFLKIKELLNKNHYKKVFVFVTHTHADHVNGLSTLVFYLHYIKKLPIEIVIPKDLVLQLQTLLSINGVQQDLFTLTETNFFNLGNSNFTLEYIKTEHVKELPCYGFFINNNTYYSGDSNVVPDKIKELLINDKIKNYYQDISLSEHEGNVHLSLGKFKSEVSKLIGKHTNVYFYHNEEFNPETKINLKELLSNEKINEYKL